LPDIQFFTPKTEQPAEAPGPSPRGETPCAGSITGKNISEDDLAGLGRFEQLAGQYLGGQTIRAGRHVATSRDFAIAFLLLRFFKNNPNQDGSLPTARVAGLWRALYEAGDVDRPWNHHRWKAIRDAMSAQGLLDWQDQRYQPGYCLGAARK
jgi:hypothetical protein